MDDKIKNRIVELLTSDDIELQNLGVRLFCDQKPLYATYLFVVRKIPPVRLLRLHMEGKIKEMVKSTTV